MPHPYPNPNPAYPMQKKPIHSKLNLEAFQQHTFFSDALDPSIKDGDKREC